MATRTIILLIDDLDGTEIVEGKGETLTFGLDGSSYEIDLTKKNASAFRKALAPYVDVAKPAQRKATTARRRQIGPTAQELRDWARSNGYTVSDRGRIPSDVRAAFEAS